MFQKEFVAVFMVVGKTKNFSAAKCFQVEISAKASDTKKRVSTFLKFLRGEKAFKKWQSLSSWCLIK